MRFTAITTVALIAAAPVFAARDAATIMDGHSQITGVTNEITGLLGGLTGGSGGSGGDPLDIISGVLGKLPILGSLLNDQQGGILGGLPLREGRSLNRRASSYDQKSVCSSFGTMGQAGGNLIGGLLGAIPFLQENGMDDEMDQILGHVQGALDPISSLLGEFTSVAPDCAHTTMSSGFLAPLTSILGGL